MKKILFILIAGLVIYFVQYFSSAEPSQVANVVSENVSTPQNNEPHLLEIPFINEGEVILRYSAMTIKYDTIHLIPAWVAYELTRSELEGEEPRPKTFRMDLNYKGPQAMREDYSNSGWDKGHMAPAADMKWSKEAMYESFYLTNICPQNHELNCQSWQKLERWCRSVAQKYGNVYIVTGPLVVTNQYGTIGERIVTIPDRFFKALLIDDKGSYHSIAFVMNNDSISQPVGASSMSVNDLEQLSGIDFFPNLDDAIEENVESENSFNSWLN